MTLEAFLQALSTFGPWSELDFLPFPDFSPQFISFDSLLGLKFLAEAVLQFYDDPPLYLNDYMGSVLLSDMMSS